MSSAHAIQLLPTVFAAVPVVLEIIGAYFGAQLTCMGVGSGVASALALMTRRSPAEIGMEATRGGAAGFIIGVPIGISAAILVAVL